MTIRIPNTQNSDLKTHHAIIQPFTIPCYQKKKKKKKPFTIPANILCSF